MTQGTLRGMVPSRLSSKHKALQLGYAESWFDESIVASTEIEAGRDYRRVWELDASF
jgi:hypothetical protein